jgi:Helix-turn-helix domain
MPFIDNELYTPDSVQEELHGRPSEATLAKWRTQGQGPAFVKVGRVVVYRGADINKWLRSRTVTRTNAPVLTRTTRKKAQERP